METSASPISVSSVSLGQITSTQFNVSITLSGSKSSEERIYVRYTTDNWSTSKHVLATGSGTSYSATVPTTSNTIFYVLTTTVNLGTDNSTFSGDYDMTTINLNNNSGNNYTLNFGFNRQVTGDAGWRLLSLPITSGGDYRMSPMILLFKVLLVVVTLVTRPTSISMITLELGKNLQMLPRPGAMATALPCTFSITPIMAVALFQSRWMRMVLSLVLM